MEFKLQDKEEILNSDYLKKDSDKNKRKKKFDLEEFVHTYRYPITVFFLGLILIGFGVIFYKVSGDSSSSEIEVLEEAKETQGMEAEVVVEIAGAVQKPGVYKLSLGSRIEDLLVSAGGYSAKADRAWVEKYINRAARLSDGQKIYILSQEEGNKQSELSAANNSGGSGGVSDVRGSGLESLTNINTATQKTLEELPGIGPVYAQSIIEHRPYSTIEELLSKEALKKNVYEKIKDLVTVY